MLKLIIYTLSLLIAFQSAIAADFTVNGKMKGLTNGSTATIKNVFNGQVLASGNITDGAFDRFSVTNTPLASLSEELKPSGQLFPNPTTDIIVMRGHEQVVYIITNAQGKVCLEGRLEQDSSQISLNDMPEGIYFLQVDGATYRILKL